MGLEHLDVVVGGRKGAGGLAHQAQQKVHPKREVAGLDDGDAPGGVVDRLLLVLRHAGGADHQGCASPFAGQPRQLGGGGASGEIDDHVAGVDGRSRVDQQAAIDRRADGVGAIEQGGNRQVLAIGDQARDHSAHASQGAAHADADRPRLAHGRCLAAPADHD